MDGLRQSQSKVAHYPFSVEPHAVETLPLDTLDHGAFASVDFLEERAVLAGQVEAAGGTRDEFGFNGHKRSEGKPLGGCASRRWGAILTAPGQSRIYRQLAREQAKPAFWALQAEFTPSGLAYERRLDGGAGCMVGVKGGFEPCNHWVKLAYRQLGFELWLCWNWLG